MKDYSLTSQIKVAGATSILYTNSSSEIGGIGWSQGRMIIGGAANWTVVDIGGSNGKVWMSNGTTASWQAVVGTGSVTSVDMTVPSALLAVSGNPITAAGTLAITLPVRAKNTFFCGPWTGADAAPAFRLMLLEDIPMNIVPTWTGYHTFNSFTTMYGICYLYGVNTTTPGLQVGVTGDAGARFAITGDGRHIWGDGAGGGDIRITRTSSALLTLDDNGSGAANLVISGLTASQFVKTNSSKQLVSDASRYSNAIWSKTASTTVSNTASDTTYLDTGVGSKTISANTVRAGTVVRIKCSGEYGTKAAATGSFTFNFYVGGASASVVIAALPASVGTGHWSAEASFTFRTIGASATCVGEASVTYKNTAVTDGIYGGYADSSSTTVDTTGSLAVEAKIAMATADASNKIIGYQATIELINN